MNGKRAGMWRRAITLCPFAGKIVLAVENHFEYILKEKLEKREKLKALSGQRKGKLNELRKMRSIQFAVVDYAIGMLLHFMLISLLFERDRFEMEFWFNIRTLYVLRLHLRIPWDNFKYLKSISKRTSSLLPKIQRSMVEVTNFHGPYKTGYADVQ